MSSALEILRTLIKYPSITPEDHGCQNYIIDFLSTLEFRAQRFPNPPVDNVYLEYGNEDGPLLLFAGHTDVVSVGNEQDWRASPFMLHQEGNSLYGRGVADMKGGLAAMLAAFSRLHSEGFMPRGKIGLLLTSAEEGNVFELGTPYVMEKLIEQSIRPTYCIVGEPSSTEQIGDVVKIGRRGSLSASVKIIGKQGHVAYPHLADNPIHAAASAIAELSQLQWDNNNPHFPASSLQITYYQAGNAEAGNVIPGECTLHFNIRYSSSVSAEQLQSDIESLFQRHKLHTEIRWRENGAPFLTSQGTLVQTVSDAIYSCFNYRPELSTSGGTSDARFIAPYGIEVVELGLVNKTIHQINECISVQSLEDLTQLYYVIIKNLL
ncbi:MAG: succinyl-diaminopimelate desuccinylase [Legionellaceae bacterium]|nr:succinyl-diaminopimelate desuccinylase [Legionellaceae bacterium]